VLDLFPSKHGTNCITTSLLKGEKIVKLSNCLTKNLTLADTLPHERILPAA